MIRSILVPMDESLSSIAACNVAVTLSQAINARLKGLYVEDIMRLMDFQPVEFIGASIGVSSGIPGTKPVAEQVEIEKKFVEESSHIKKTFEELCINNKIKNNFKIKRGKINEIIIQESKTVDMVIMGKRGETYPKNSKELGPVTELILRSCTKPVMVIPENSNISLAQKQDRKILIAYDSSETSQRALSIGTLFGLLIGAQVRVINIANEKELSENYLSEAKEFHSSYPELEFSYKSAIGEAMPWIEINKEIEGFKPSLVVLGAFGNKKFLELVFGSTTKQVLMETNCPVLLCR